MNAPAGASCAAHPDRRAGDVCARCGTFLCGACVELYESQTYCAKCRARMGSLMGGSWVSIAAGICGFVGLGCGPLSIVALLAALVDLSMIAGGRSRKGGWKLDLLAIGMAVLGILIWGFIAWRIATGQVKDSDFDG